MEQTVFMILAVGTLVSAIGVISPQMSKTPIHSALWLIVTFLCLSGIYVLLVAHVIAVLQVLVYAGAIMVLFVFVIMLLNLGEYGSGKPKKSKGLIRGIFAAVLVGLVAFQLYGALIPSGHSVTPTDLSKTEMSGFGTMPSIGEGLFGRYLVPFELLALLLLVALVGALVLAKKNLNMGVDEGGSSDQEGSV